MARDGLFFASFAELHPRFRTPVAAIVVQGTWAIGLLLTGSYGQLLDYVTFADWIFFGITAATLFVYRRREGSATPGYRAPFHPVGAILFCAACVYVVAGAIASNPWNAARGAVLLAAGIPVFHYWSRRARWRAAAQSGNLRG
jgi:APA family basic amino acid/polyamine antiporter